MRVSQCLAINYRSVCIIVEACREVGFRYSIIWCTPFGLNSRRAVAIVQDYHDGSGRRTLVRLQERKAPLKIDFMYNANLVEFLAGFDDGEVVVHISLEVRGVVKRAHDVLDGVGVEWIMKFAVVTPG